MKLSVTFIAKIFKDKPTGCWVIYSKRFDVSAYGKTKKQAMEMFREQVYEFLKLTKQK